MLPLGAIFLGFYPWKPGNPWGPLGCNQSRGLTLINTAEGKPCVMGILNRVRTYLEAHTGGMPSRAYVPRGPHWMDAQQG